MAKKVGAAPNAVAITPLALSTAAGLLAGRDMLVGARAAYAEARDHPVEGTDVQYIGNVALTHFDGPPVELLKKLGLS